MVKVPNDRLLWGLSAIILLSAFIVSPGFFSIDEAVYYLGARAVAEWGSLGIDSNGYHQFHSESLRLRFLVDGPQGLTPQYPAGSALLAAPLLPFLGGRAFILLNALAAVLMLFTVRSICLSQFKSETVWRIAAGLLVAGTFWLEYAVGVWPHMLSAYFALQAYWFALRHLDSEREGYRDAILSGLFAGAGMLFRLDAVLAVPAIGLIMVMFAPRFVRSSFFFGAGVLPSLVLASWLNTLKFGTPNPFSYGQSGGNTDLSAHAPLLAALCVGFAALALLRQTGWRIDRKATIASLVILLGALLVIPATNALLLRFWHGFMALVVDIRGIVDFHIGVRQGPGGTLIFWSLVKKSLGQSMPWIGLAAMVLTSGVQKSDRRFIATLLTFIATMATPFILLSWHGGGGSNMRYFLPVLPMLCILCAKLISDLWPSVPNATAFTAAGVWATIILGLAWTFLHPSGYAGVQQIISTYVLLATAGAAFMAGIPWAFQQEARRLAIALFGSGFIISMTSAAADFQEAQKRRMMAHGISETVGSVPPGSVVITLPEWGTLRLPGNGSIVATRDPESRRADPQLIFDALDAGRRVYMTSFEFSVLRDVPPGLESVATDYKYSGGRMIELRRIPPGQP